MRANTDYEVENTLASPRPNIQRGNWADFRLRMEMIGFNFSFDTQKISI